MIKNNKDNHILNISLPVVAEMLIATLMSIIDLIMIGNAGGNKYVTSVGLSNGIINTLVNIFIITGICIAITSIVSRKAGAKKFQEADEYASLGFFAGFIISLLIFLFIFYFSRQILIFGGAKGEILKNAYLYTKISSFSFFILMINSLLFAIFRAHGDTVTPFFISCIIFFVKVLLNFLFIYIFKTYCAIIIVAVSSIISQFIGLLSTVFVLENSRLFTLKLKYIINFSTYKILEILKLSIPSSLEEAAYSISRLLCSFIIVRSGSIAYAANEIANSIESISVMPAIGFGISATTLVGTDIGEHNSKKAVKSTNSSAFYSIMLMMFFAIIFILIPHEVVKIYVGKSEVEVLKYAAICLMIGAFEQPTIAISSVFAGALKGMGDTKTPFIISLISGWLIRLPLIYYFISYRKLSVAYVWITTDLQWGFDALFAYIYFKKRIKDPYRYDIK